MVAFSESATFDFRKEHMDTAITLNGILGVIGVIVAIVAGIGAIVTIIKFITGIHDRMQKWDEYDQKITEVNAKIQQIQAEQCMQTYVLQAVLDGLHQLNCNGRVTEASEKLNKHINKQAHGVES